MRNLTWEVSVSVTLDPDPSCPDEPFLARFKPAVVETFQAS